MDEIVYLEDETEKIRLDKYLTNILKDMSRSHIQTLIKNKNILVNDQKIKSGYLLIPEDKISIKLPKISNSEAKPENIPLDIIYEDDDIIVVNKPKGMVVHPSAGHNEGTLVNALLYHCGDSLSGINGKMRPGIVHRIDKDTTGLLIACKNDRAHNIIAAQLYNHSMTRWYTALCFGTLKERSLTINAPIERSKTNRKMMTVSPSGEGRKAITHVEVMENYFPGRGNINQSLSLIKCVLETGRTHQIRVHMKYINHPVAGDELYGLKKDPLKGQGQYLHAEALGFTHPSTGEKMLFTAPLPGYFKETLRKLRKACLTSNIY